MKLILLILSLLFLLNSIVLAAPPKCLTTNNVYYDFKHHKVDVSTDQVDWWYLHSASHAYGSFYTDSRLSKIEKIIQLPLYNVRVDKEYINPFYKTYLQTLQNIGTQREFKSLIYNEQIEAKEGDGAHSKGFFIWNDEGGIHVIHSNPETPKKDYPTDPNFTEFMIQGSDGSQHAQHHFCRTIGKNELDIIPKYIILGDIRVVGINGKYINVKRFSKIKKSIKESDSEEKFNPNQLIPLSSQTKLTYKMVYDFIDNNLMDINKKLLFHINKWIQIAQLVSKKKITSSPTFIHQYFSDINSYTDGRYFIQSTIKDAYSPRLTSVERNKKNSMAINTKYNLIYEYVSQLADYKDMEWICQTETKLYDYSKARNQGNIMPYQKYNNIQVVYRFAFEWNYPKDGHDNIDVNSGHDHTKLFYGYYNNDPSKSIMCIGDLNWQGAQELRGGGLFCSNQMAYLANYMRRHAVLFRYPEDRELNDFGVNSPNTVPPAGTTLYKKYLNDGFSFNSGALVGFDFTNVKTNLQTIQDNGKAVVFNFEIRSLKPSALTPPPPKEYIPLPGNRIIIMNKKLKNPKYTGTDTITFSDPVGYDIKYNCGYEKVYIPLLIESFTKNTVYFDFQMEEYSFNAFTSPYDNLYVCPDIGNKDCYYQDSEYVQLFTHKPVGRYQIKKEIFNDIKVVDAHFLAQLTPSVKVNLEEKYKLIKYVSLIKNINSGFTKTIKLAKLDKPSGFVQKFDNFDKTLCNKVSSLDPNSIIVQYYDGCFDILFYCFKNIDQFKVAGDDISKGKTFKQLFEKFNVSKMSNLGTCFDYSIDVGNNSDADNDDGTNQRPKKKKRS